MNEHLLKKFDEELGKLRFRLVKMGTLVQQQIELALRSIFEDSEQNAKRVSGIEEKVNKLDVKIDKQCLRILALHQPVAMDLRQVLSAVSINDYLEMIGDIATIISKSYAGVNYIPGIAGKTRIGEISRQMNAVMSNIMDAFVYLDIDHARQAVISYEDLSRLTDENFSIITGLMKSDPGLIDQMAHLIDTNRSIQIISMLAKGIAEELVFLVEARLIKHQTIDRNDLKSQEEDESPGDSIGD